MANLSERPRVVAPHVALGSLRTALGLTLDQVCERYQEATGETITRGALSAIENGIRGASVKVLGGLEVAYGLRPGEITTAYEPKVRAA